MVAVGYTRCTEEGCDSLVRGYKPRGWKEGDELHAFAHRHAGLEASPARYGRHNCEGSYRAGRASKLDSDTGGTR